MFKKKSPENYNEMLESLSSKTFWSTLIFFIVLRILDIIPLVKISPELIPKIKDWDDTITYICSFGVIPLIIAFICGFLSQNFEIHNLLSKVLQIRYFWDKCFIVEVLVKRAGVTNITLNKLNVKRIMNEFYYSAVKEIDQHYVKLFWRYALTFWALFEHLVVITITSIILFFSISSKNFIFLWSYLLLVLIATICHFIFITAKKSTDQANAINLDKIKDYLSSF